MPQMGKTTALEHVVRSCGFSLLLLLTVGAQRAARILLSAWADRGLGTKTGDERRLWGIQRAYQGALYIGDLNRGQSTVHKGLYGPCRRFWICFYVNSDVGIGAWFRVMTICNYSGPSPG